VPAAHQAEPSSLRRRRIPQVILFSLRSTRSLLIEATG
jgi:hypothetical protein